MSLNVVLSNALSGLAVAQNVERGGEGHGSLRRMTIFAAP